MNFIRYFTNSCLNNEDNDEVLTRLQNVEAIINSSSIFIKGKILEEVQMSQILSNPKDFVDMVFSFIEFSKI